MSRNLKKKSSGDRYSSEIINITLSIYSRSKSGYEELKQAMSIALPSARNIEHYLEPLRFKDGSQPIRLAMMYKLKENARGDIYGHLMMDEIKLKNDIMWNCKNNCVTGYIPDELDTKI